MIGKAIAGWIGNRIDRRDGEGGTHGALIGVAAYEVGKRVIPPLLLLGAATAGVMALRRKSAPAS